MATKKKPNFEKSLEELESLVIRLESGELSLEDSLETFEKGIKLTRNCQTALQEAEQKVDLLLKQSDGSLVSEDFNTDSIEELGKGETR